MRESNEAKQEASAAEGEFGTLDEELQSFLIDLIGLTDAKNCLGKGDIGACLSAAAQVAPWGKAFKILKSLPKAYKLWKKFKSLWDRVNAARKRRQAAESRLEKALQACKTRPKNSFVPGTPVLLADGSRRPIEDVRVGDRVWASDPVTGVSGSRPVTALITGSGRKDLVDVTVAPDGLPGGSRVVVTATDGHPFWVANAAAWIDAENLVYGDTLIAPGGRSASVVGIRERTRVQRVYNLTVAGLHTYHVTAGGTDVLVHNQGPEDECGPGDPTVKRPDDFPVDPPSGPITGGVPAKFRDHFQRHKALLEAITGKKYKKFKEDGPTFLKDLDDMIKNGTLKYEGPGSMKKGTEWGYVFRNDQVTLVLNKDGSFRTLLERGKGIDLSIIIDKA
ncbi:polymorphic toxin-type HINT domain-containing protein [Actinomadura sp. HBU206391]|uniref:polymorphic toxin-type HINT domain-containing protein n=1 Tax=Actinomadura sp. HBU206391 TaxID=2731692 RepID=UPI00164F92CB|nr:polymorphic toxin-type HINT domain-containing protein [Actinomadura sp. HBU206391]MBC6456733.1 hypothetical protein [Actinomadura sp. HBU206391]